jgi:hypothetical protein
MVTPIFRRRVHRHSSIPLHHCVTLLPMYFFLPSPPRRTAISQRTVTRSLVRCALLAMLMAPTFTEPLSRLSGIVFQRCWIICKPPSSRSTWTLATSSPSCGECKQEVRWQVPYRSLLTVSRHPCIIHPTSKCRNYPHEAGELYAVRGIRGVPKRRCRRENVGASDMFVSWVGRRDA